MLAKADVTKPAVRKARARRSSEGKAAKHCKCRYLEIKTCDQLSWKTDMINFLILAVSGDDRKHRWLAARQQNESSHLWHQYAKP